MVRLLVRVLCKIYEGLLRGYTAAAFGCKADASEILVASLAPLQLELQQKLDQRSLVIPSAGTVLVIIPFKDQWAMTEACLESLAQQILPDGVRLRVVLVDNCSVEEATFSGLTQAEQRWPTLRIKTFKAAYAFNYSRLNNDAVRAVLAEEPASILCLNNDVELLDPSVIGLMTKVLASHSEVGIVGATLLYPDRSLQHLFAVPGVKIVAAHPLKHTVLKPSSAWQSRPLRVVPAVTGALMMVRTGDFLDVGMFDEDLPTLGQDIDLCLKMFKLKGLVSTVLTRDAAIHHESKTKKSGFSKPEVERFYQRWRTDMKTYPLYSQRFSRWSERPLFHIGVNEPDYPWNKIIV